ncbi:MAG: ice-binding family protein [Paludibacter sp.]|nr:ice-binding family protein [Paludibacter sp.]
MKTNLLHTATALLLLFVAQFSIAESPNLGSAAGFVLFSSDGAVSNSGKTHLTGNVGTNNGSSTAFGNVDGVMHDNDGVSALCSGDLLIAYNQLNAAVPAFFPAPLLGNGQLLNAGIYSISAPTTLDNVLTLDGQGNANAEFIFKIGGAFSTGAFSQVILVNGAKACNVYWKVEGLVSIATGTKMVGTIIANNAAINMYTGVELEGRALSTTGAITVNGITARTPIGCGSPLLTGPTAPDLASTACYAFFSGAGDVTNTGVSLVTGDVGTNVGSTVGFEDVNVDGTIHLLPNVSTGIAAADLTVVYNYLKDLTYDIKLLYPVQFGNNLVLTPHIYMMEGAAVFTDSLYLNAQGNSEAVFVIKINGALTTSTYAKVLLINGAQAKNVYWLVEGAVDINEYSEFKGTLVANTGSAHLKSGVKLNGRLFTTVGALSTAAVAATIPEPCPNTGLNSLNSHDFATVYPNPVTRSIMITISDLSKYDNSQLNIYNSVGSMIINKNITQEITTIETNFSSGVYFYKLTSEDKSVQTGKLILK